MNLDHSCMWHLYRYNKHTSHMGKPNVIPVSLNLKVPNYSVTEHYKFAISFLKLKKTLLSSRRKESITIHKVVSCKCPKKVIFLQMIIIRVVCVFHHLGTFWKKTTGYYTRFLLLSDLRMYGFHFVFIIAVFVLRKNKLSSPKGIFQQMISSIIENQKIPSISSFHSVWWNCNPPVYFVFMLHLLS